MARLQDRSGTFTGTGGPIRACRCAHGYHSVIKGVEIGDGLNLLLPRIQAHDDHPSTADGIAGIGPVRHRGWYGARVKLAPAPP